MALATKLRKTLPSHPTRRKPPETPVPPEAQYLRFAGAMKALGMSRKSIERAMSNGEIPFARIGGIVIFPVEGLRKLAGGQN